MRARMWSSRRTAKSWPHSVVMSSCVAGEVADHLVDAVHAYGGEMIAQGAEIALGVGEQAVVHQALDLLALDLQAVARHVEQLIEAAQQRCLVALILDSPGARN